MADSNPKMSPLCAPTKCPKNAKVFGYDVALQSKTSSSTQTSNPHSPLAAG
jgi:hypothetical protein